MTFKKFIFNAFLLFYFLPASTQTLSSISGSITNGVTPVSGVSIHLLNTSILTTTDQNGIFTIHDVPYGRYIISFNSSGYAVAQQEILLSKPSETIQITLTSSAKQLDEVVVTAQKHDETAKKLPLSLSTLTSKQIEEYKLWNARDLTAIVPNLYSSNPGDNRNVTSLRGIATTSYDPSVATYIDGVNQFSLDTYIAQLQDIEQIEVLRGPQGTLYGRNAMGGVINITTKQPTNHTQGFAEINFGNFGLQRYNIGFRTPLIQNKLFFGVSGMYSSSNGFYTNEFNNTNFDDQHTFLGNYFLKYQVDNKWAVILNLKNATNKNGGAFPLAADKESAFENPFTVNQNATTDMVDNQLNSSLSVNYNGSNFNFTSQSTYQTDYRYYKQPIDGDFSPIDGVSIVNNYGKDWNKVKVGTQEFRFSSPAAISSPFKWIAGVYGFYQDNPVKQGTHFGEDAELVGAPFPNFTSININQQKKYGFALFGQGTYSISTKLDFTLGLRYDYEHDKQAVEGQFQPDGEDVIITQPDTSSKAHFDAFSPKLSLLYKLDPSNNIYAVYSKGFRAGGISQLSSDPSQPPLFSYNPESSNNYELGFKSTLFNKRADFNISLFYTAVNNAQVPTLVLPDAITITRNAGKLESKGLEFEALLKPVNGLEIDYSFGYTDAEYTKLDVPSDGSAIDLSGNKQIFTPDITSLLAVQYGYKFKNNIQAVIRGEWKYLGKQYFNLANTIEQNPYDIFNARIGMSYNDYGIFFWGSNLFDKTYIDYAYDFGAVHLGNPKTYGLTFSKRF
ncbi:TonB-dependent receptor [Pedobacter sp. HMF7647]|uniref:TonB-dependent receptor n=1 Tax=Hufsiella arboris TaxID=2695275 RepID=A0A7K1Y9N6_9SPHI|nr:TonB-dependent receptor [Hufsiella arboris]MXV51297.1 TonB-dependent receptor [Hufsiella arboris]